MKIDEMWRLVQDTPRTVCLFQLTKDTYYGKKGDYFVAYSCDHT